VSILNRPYFREEEAAHSFLEGILWATGAVCPHCGVVGTAYKIAANPEKRVRYGLWKCRDCRKQFTVKIGTVFEHVRLPLHKALQATFLLCSSKKGISAHQLSRMLEISLKAAWFIGHRVREAMAPHTVELMGGEGKIIEADESYVGGKERNKHRSKRNKDHIGGVGKEMVFSLVERGGKVRSRHLPSVSAKNLRPVLNQQIADASKTKFMTDGEGQYRLVADMFASHEVVNHGIGEYVLFLDHEARDRRRVSPRQPATLEALSRGI
jgi:transposase-like protein